MVKQALSPGTTRWLARQHCNAGPYAPMQLDQSQSSADRIAAGENNATPALLSREPSTQTTPCDRRSDPGQLVLNLSEARR